MLVASSNADHIGALRGQPLQTLSGVLRFGKQLVFAARNQASNFLCPLMEQYNHIELVSLCDSILGSGEVTQNDAYNLADWLNNHREACFHWPGERLVAPLQEIWADGKVTPTESHRLAGLLRSILKEWTKIYYDESMKGAHQRVQDLIAVLPPTEPRLPGIELTL